MERAVNRDPGAWSGLEMEYVCLETEEAGAARAPRASDAGAGPTFRFVASLRGRETEMAFSSDQRLSILQRWPRRPPRHFAVDLRFVDPGPRPEWRIGWRWWLAAAVLAGLATSWIGLEAHVVAAPWRRLGLQASIVLATAAACAVLVGVYRTRETLELRSAHGNALLGEITVGRGCAHEARSFVAELTRRIEMARSATPRTRQQFLRDEMREHHRLWNDGILTDAEYEASKRRILAAHS